MLYTERIPFGWTGGPQVALSWVGDPGTPNNVKFVGAEGTANQTVLIKLKENCDTDLQDASVLAVSGSDELPSPSLFLALTVQLCTL